VRKSIPKIGFRRTLSDKLMDLGNLIVVGMAVGQFGSNSTFSYGIFTTGIFLTVLCYIVSYAVYTKG
jgi:hypothetical protein